VVSARTSGNVDEASGVSLFVVDKGTKGVTIRPVKTMDGHRAAFVRFEGVSVGADAMLGGEGEGAATLEYVLDVAAAAACAEGLGVAAATLAMTLDYLKTREQFGVKIGTFQALQHRAVDMFVQVELCRSLSIEANIRVDGCQQRAGSPSPENDVLRKAAVSAAKVQLSRGGRFVTQQGIQLHGGIGCTDEHDVGLYFKRMQVLATMFGDEEYHVRRFASLPSFDAA